MGVIAEAVQQFMKERISEFVETFSLNMIYRSGAAATLSSPPTCPFQPAPSAPFPSSRHEISRDSDSIKKDPADPSSFSASQFVSRASRTTSLFLATRAPLASVAFDRAALLYAALGILSTFVASGVDAVYHLWRSALFRWFEEDVPVEPGFPDAVQYILPSLMEAILQRSLIEEARGCPPSGGFMDRAHVENAIV